jgi:RNA polymerase sigma-70 factor (ECF subfamily)
MDQIEFLQLTAPFKDKVFRLAKRLLISTEEAEDTMQEVLGKLWNKKENLYAINSVEAFAMTMTRNYCLDQLKSKKAGNLKINHDNYTDESSKVDQTLEDEDTMSWVERIINQLPEQQKIIIQLRDIEQYEFNEIAQIVDMNETAIRVALSRARKTVRQNMIKIHSYGIE